MFNLFSWWRNKVKCRKEREGKTPEIVKPTKPKRSFKEIRKSRGTSLASIEQKRQHKARMITRRMP